MRLTDEQRDSLFDIVCYLVSCARLTLDEAPRYGSQRLLVGASRLIASATGEDAEDAALRAWKAAIDENVFKMALAYPEYVEWLSQFTRAVGREAAERALSPDAAPASPSA